MDDETKNELTKMIKAAMKEETPAAPKDPRIADIEFFWQIIPHILGGCISSNQIDSRPAMQKAFLTAREAVGQACMMGLCKPVTVLSDGNLLASMPSNMGAPSPAPNQQPMMPGNAPGMVAQQPMAGVGGFVAQYPMNQQSPMIVSGGGGVSSIPPGGMVAQYPMNSDAPMTYGGAVMPTRPDKAVMTRQFPMDPTMVQMMAPLVNQGPQPGTRQYVAAQAAVPPPPGYVQPQAPPGYVPQQGFVPQGPVPQGYPQPPTYPQHLAPNAPPGYVPQQPVQYGPPPAVPQAQPQYGPPPAVPQGYVQAPPPPQGFVPIAAPQAQPGPVMAVPQGPMGPQNG